MIAAFDLPAVMLGMLIRTPDPVLVADSGRRIVFGNLAAKALVRFEIGKPLDLEQFPGWSGEVIRQDALPTAERSGTWSGEITISAPDGVTRTMTLVVVCEKGAGGEAPFTAMMLHDVTDMQGQLVATVDLVEHASRAKSQFLSNMSHELRTPLNAILNYAEIVREDANAAGFTAIVEDVERIEKASRQLLDLVEDVLDLSSVELGRVKLESDDFELEPMLDEVIRIVEPLADRNRNTFEWQLPARDSRFRGDRLRLKQCLLNLLDNACKFTVDGIIRLTVQKTQREIVFIVDDTGIGMSDEQVMRLFVPFEQADMTNARRFGGTGLGLVLTKTFTELLGGTLTVRSTLGTGTSFAMHFHL